MGSEGKFELMMFSGDNKFRRVLTADNCKIKILQTTDCASTVGHGYLYRKRKRTSETSWYRGIPMSQFSMRSDTTPPTLNHKSGG